MRRLLLRVALSAGLLPCLTMCRPHPPPGAAERAAVTPPAQAPPAPPAAERQTLRLEPLDGAGSASGNAVALARVGERTIAFIADADDQAVATFDVEARALLATTPLGTRPSAVLVTPAGRVVALGAQDARVHVLAATAIDAPLVEERSFDVPDEPVSVTVTPAGDVLLVASRWGHALTVVSLASDAPPVVVDLPRDPAAVIASSDGRRAIVLHAAGSRASMVDLASHEAHTASLDFAGFAQLETTPMMPETPLKLPVAKGHNGVVHLQSDQTFALVRLDDGRLAAPDVAVDTGPPGASDGYGASQTPAAAAVTTFPADWNARAAPAGHRLLESHCLLPRAAALAGGDRVLVACTGSDTVVTVLVRQAPLLDVTAKVGRGPAGIGVDRKNGRAVVWSAFDRVVSVLALDRALAVTSTTVVPRVLAAPDKAALRGRRLFHAVLDRRVSLDGRACASCHPDGRDDGLSWSAPGGRRQTPMLLERLEGTAPYGWDGAAQTLARHVAQTTRRLGGSGLRASDVDDVAAYLATLRPPARRAPGELARRGAEVFASSAAQCATCHAAGGTDGDSHDVQSTAPGDARLSFDTPSLHLVGHSAPYFHDGRYASLRELVDGVDGTMGHTAQLSPDERTALAAYLQTL